MPKTALLVGTHALCLLGGGLLLHLLPAPKNPDSGKPAEAPTKFAEHPAVDPLAAEGGRIAAHAVSRARAFPAFYDPAEALRLANEMPPGEGERRVRALTGDGVLAIPRGEEFAAAYIAWFCEDPEAVLRFFRTIYYIPKELLTQALDGISIEDHATMALKLHRKCPGSDRLFQALAPRLAALDASEATAFFHEHFSISESRDQIQEIVRAWPADRFASLADLAVAVGDPVVVLLALDDQRNAKKAVGLFRLLETRGYLPVIFEKYKYIEGSLRERLYQHAGPEVPLEERIDKTAFAWRGETLPEGHRERNLGLFATYDVHELLENGPDLHYAFRQGAMTADQVLAAVETALPELNSAAAQAVRLNVYRELAWDDAQAAYSLLAALPEKERKLTVLTNTSPYFFEGYPAAFYKIVELAPGPDTPEEAAARAEAWKGFAGGGYRNFGDDYIEWVRQLPPGPNRDAARASLAERLENTGRANLSPEFRKP